MKSTFLMVLVVAFFSGFAKANPSLDLMKEVIGTYSVLSFNGEQGKGGTLSIQANGDGVGWVSDQVIPSADPTAPVKSLSVITPADQTIVTRNGNVIVQQGTVTTERRSSVTYEIFDGYITVQSDVCWPSGACETLSQIVTTGKAPGTPVNVADFFTSIAGSYEVLTDGGVKPDKPETLDVDIESDPAEPAIYAQHCDPVTHTCDLGYYGFPHGLTAIFDNSPSATEKFYDLFVGTGPTAKHFSWAEKDGVISYKNYQYVLPNTTTPFVLEHVAKRYISDETTPEPEPVEPTPAPEQSEPIIP